MSKLYSLFLDHPIITTDSRDCPAGSIFFALKGENFNGNAYAASALEKGCSYAVVDEQQYAVDDRFILVPDVLTALQQLANEHRRALGTPIVGITGTNGKTTTKELIAAVLSEKYNVLYTQGNFNNHIGVPKTLLQLREEHEIAVIEMGANHPGEIKTLVDIVEPDCGIITNVGKAHLEGFGSFEGVIKTKGELYDFLRSKGNSDVFICSDNEHLMNIADGLHLIKYNIKEEISVDMCESLKNDGVVATAMVGECAPFLSFSWMNTGATAPTIHNVNTHLIGTFNVYNMLAAATIGLSKGVTEEQICHALSSYIPKNNRSQLTITAHNKLIVDTYNANPTSMMAALSNFRDMAVSPKMAILGDMRELGEVSMEEHQKVVDFLQEANITDVWLVGDEFGKTDCDFRKFSNVQEVKDELEKSIPTDKYILIKGSNGTKLFQLPELL